MFWTENTTTRQFSEDDDRARAARPPGFGLDPDVATYRPEFAELQVLEGFDGDTPRLRAPASQATVRNLATHTSGLAYWFWNKDIDHYEQYVPIQAEAALRHLANQYSYDHIDEEDSTLTLRAEKPARH